ncbi:MAG: hypothetical protein U0T56_12170 [Ferruginibacter sp.]
MLRLPDDLCVMDVRNGAFHLLERAPGASDFEEIKAKTAGKLIIEGDVPGMRF